jgi:hypothetical protein
MVETAIQLNIVVPNVPSSLARVSDKLRASGINISAITCTEGANETVIHLIVDDPETAKIVLKDLGAVNTTDVLAIKMKNAPGAISAIARECAAAGINIRNIYSTTCGKEAMVYISVNDIDTAVGQLKTWRMAHH